MEVKSEELAAVVREIRERVRARYPEHAAAPGIALPDLLQVLHARDAAQGKVAAIGTVNPRPRGLINAVVQAAKRLISRALDWHVRDQVEFNRAAVACFDAVIEALNENNRALERLGSQAAALLKEAAELKDVRSHWAEWRAGWETKLAANEVQFLRAVADLESAFTHRVTLIESNMREMVKSQHDDFIVQYGRAIMEVRQELERVVHAELRVIRQRAAIAPLAAEFKAAPQPAEPLPFDYGRFAERFRGTEEYVRERQRFYLEYFRDCRDVLDIGCGRGEFLELMKEAEVPARGIDLSAESIALCRSKGLSAEAADLFAYLDSLEEESLDGIFSAQVIEHLPPERLPLMLRLSASRLRRGGVMAIETPNPECLAIFATHFYLDPTHHRPIPSPLLVFYLEEFGMGRMEVKRLAPAADSMPEVNQLPPEFRDAFFGGLDYCVIARKL